MSCPECMAVNSPNARKCRCGFNFQTFAMEAPEQSAKSKRIMVLLVIGFVLVFAEICIFYLD
jgi:hypothetical protein